ncbi:MAG TPA: arginine--tRNA ligase [Pseudobacteroides sp.]|uniref:arginine--tRNA ligase n=1 Tax=Pseudobacteroides sp. TaxID=1968840 RepID=UPI002F950B55
MTNVIQNLTEEIKKVISKSLIKAYNEGELPQVEVPEITIEIPREEEHGEFSTNVAMQITKQVKKAPRQTAEIIIKNMELENTYIEKVECAGPGFINFYLNVKWLYDAIQVIQAERENYGKINLGNGAKVMVEFVSANPTGPLHMGNARGGALGDCIANVLKAAGYDVTKEFYINDAGNQIEKFGKSLEARYLQLLLGEEAVAFPEDGYQGEDITDHMRDYIAQNGDKLLNAESSERQRTLVEYALPINLQRIRTALKNYGIEFDVWFSEQSLYDSGELQETLDFIKSKGYAIEKEGAIWFKATEFGIEKDEVIVRNNGLPTYFASDIAYHKNKFLKRKFDRVINLLGADHHGHVARMKAAVSAMGIDANKLDVVLFQLVRLFKNGEAYRMSKRTGRAVSLNDLLEELGKDGERNDEEAIIYGKDAARFFFNMKASGSHLDFDMSLAVEKSNENPVFYVQYAHARICSIIKLAKEQDGVELPDIGSVDLSLLNKKEELDLIKALAQFPEEIRIAANTLEPSRLTRYVLDVAGYLHSFYNACRIRGEEKNVMKARLLLIDSTRTVIRNVLSILSISAPEKMEQKQ